MDNLWQDLRHSLRALRRRPARTAVLLLTLGIGIGLVSGVFSVVDGVLLRGLPFRDPARLVEVAGLHRRAGEVEEWPVSYLDFQDWRRPLGPWLALAAYSPRNSFNLMAEGEPEHLDGELVSAGYFQVLGVGPVTGRAFTAEEDSAGDPRYVAVLGHDLWCRRFGCDPGVVGRQIRLDGRAYEVVGVMPAGFRGATDSAQLWTPVGTAGQVLARHYVDNRRFRWLAAVGRLRPGRTVAGAQAALDTAAAALAREHPATNQGIGARVTPLQEAWTGDLRLSLLVLLAAAVLVLLIACVNVASLLLSRALERRREISVRSALGAGRRRLARQLLTESLVLSALGCALGLAVAEATVRLLARSSAAGLRSFVHLGLDPLVTGVALATSLVCGLGLGLVPLGVALHDDLAALLREGERGSPRQRFQGALVVAEVALALALLTGAGLAVRDFQRLNGRGLGFRTGLLTLRLDLKGPAYVQDPAVAVLVRRILEGVGGLAGVRSVALAGPGVPTDGWSGAGFTVEDRRDPAEDGAFTLGVHHVSPGYFATLGIPILRGRDLLAQDDARVMPYSIVVSDAVARRLWPGGSAVGRRLKMGRRDGPFPWFVVVGVAGDARQRGLAAVANAPGTEDLYFAVLQFPPKVPPVLNILVRPAEGVGPAALAAPVRRAVRAIDPELPLYDVATLEERLAGQVAGPRLLVQLMGLFSLLALTLAALGIYGLITNAVVRRTREVGVRIALGADRQGVIGWLVRQGAALAALGVAIGLAASLLLARLLRAYLHGVETIDPLTFAATALLLLGTGVLASYAAARRASGIEPSAALRSE
jgi:predicted permease